MHQDERDYNEDNGFKSRKFLLSIVSIIMIVLMAIMFAILGLGVDIFNTLCTSIVTIVLGYAGISATRSAVPRYAQNRTKGQTRDRRRPERPKRRDSSDEEPEEGEV